MVNLEVLSVNELSMDSAHWHELGTQGGGSPETGYLRNYNPLWKNDLSGNWIINDPRQRNLANASPVGYNSMDSTVKAKPYHETYTDFL